MPNSETRSAFVETATKCAATASSPSAATNHDRAVRAFVSVSIVPNVVGMTPQDATATLRRLGFVVTVVGQTPSDLPAGLVALSSPQAGSTVYDGSTISLYLSTGTAAVPPPAATPPGQAGPTSGPTSGTSSGPGTGHGHGHGH